MQKPNIKGIAGSISLMFMICLTDIVLVMIPNTIEGADVIQLKSVHLTAGVVKKMREAGKYKVDTVKRMPLPSEISNNFKEYILRPGEKIKGKIRKNIFVKIKAAKTTCYLGEPVLVTYKLYSRLNSVSKVIRQPSLNGFSVYEMDEHTPLYETVEKIEGRSYEVHTLKKVQLVPVQTGNLELDPPELEATVQFIKGMFPFPGRVNQLNDVLDQLLEEEKAPVINHTTKITGQAVTISVKPLPEVNMPLNFSGAVGRFNINASVYSNHFTIGNPAILNIELKGDGYRPFVDAPAIKWPAGIDSFDVRITETGTAITPLQGTKIFEYTFIPRKEGRYSIPPVTFTCFDPISESYKIIQTLHIDFQVDAGDPKSIDTKNVRSSETPVKNINPASVAIQYIKEHYAEILSVIFSFAMAILLYSQHVRRKGKTRQDELRRTFSGMHETQLHEAPQDPLEEIKTLYLELQYTAFYRKLNDVLWTTLSKKLNLSPSELTKNSIAKHLALRGWNNDMVSNLQSVLIVCERNIYITGYHTDVDLLTQLEIAISIMADLQKL